MTTSRLPRIAAVLALSMCSLALQCEGCSDTGERLENPKIGSLTGTQLTGTVGEQLAEPIGVELEDEGKRLPNQYIQWAVLSGGGSLVVQNPTDENGRGFAVWTLGPTAGEQQISAGFSVREVIFTATALPGPAETLIASEALLTFDALGDSAEVSLSAVDRFGNNTSTASAVWTSLDDSVATVDTEGTVVARGNGSTSVIATLASAADTVLIEVDQAATTIEIQADSVVLDAIDATQALTAEVRDAGGNVIDAQVAWSIHDTAVASVTQDGTVQARAVGRTTVSAGSGPYADTVLVIVDQAIADVTLTAGATTIEVGETMTLTAGASDANGYAVATDFAWNSTDADIASVDGAGVVTGVGVGSVFLRASTEGVADSVEIEVMPFDTFRVEPDSVLLASAGDSAILQALVPGPADSLVAIEAAWLSRDTTVATATDAGVVTATGTGATWIIAQVPGDADSAYVAVGSVSGAGIRR